MERCGVFLPKKKKTIYDENIICVLESHQDMNHGVGEQQTKAKLRNIHYII